MALKRGVFCLVYRIFKLFLGVKLRKKKELNNHDHIEEKRSKDSDNNSIEKIDKQNYVPEVMIGYSKAMFSAILYFFALIYSNLRLFFAIITIMLRKSFDRIVKIVYRSGKVSKFLDTKIHFKDRYFDERLIVSEGNSYNVSYKHLGVSYGIKNRLKSMKRVKINNMINVKFIEHKKHIKKLSLDLK